MSEKPHSRSSGPDSPPTGRHLSRGAGIAISVVTAAVVFAAGMIILPPTRGTPPNEGGPVDAHAATDVGAPAQPGAGGAGGGDTGGAGGEAAAGGGDGQGGASATDASSEADGDASSSPTDAAADGGDKTDGPVAAKDGPEPAPDCTLPDKDIARESWRRNWPTQCTIADGEKAFLIIPIKGSVDGEIHELRRRPNREARVNLPGAESLLTMKQYKLRRLGFKELRIAMDEGGTRLRAKLLNGAGDPLFEVKDGYVKITVGLPNKE